ncbi:hypothetical protein P175DRAFT_0464190, partial [Aspergillus ochraceoroseus IBT 24754]|uniref:AttH domain-containing protein n=2 Tax=Aspergillus ochraceoroseus TaxID=138278 RepID=A0A0F8U8Y0_9EURO
MKYSWFWMTTTTLAPVLARYTLTLPPSISIGPVNADFSVPSLDQSDLAAPKLDRVNASSFDWWYFDAIATDNPNTTVAVAFVSAGPSGSPFPLPGSEGNGTGPGIGVGNETAALFAHVWVTYPNGSSLVKSGIASQATVSGSGDSSMGLWSGGGGWMGSEEGYEVSLEMPGVRGTISMDKITPPHSHCSAPGQFNTSLELGPLGWVSILPDAIASVDIDVHNGERLRFDGYGYHDKNWSNRPFAPSTKSLFRGHAHLGNYSVVWVSYVPAAPPSFSPSRSHRELDMDMDMDMDMETEMDLQADPEILSVYIARDGETVSASCAANAVSYRAVREETEGGPVSGYEVVLPGARLQVATDVEVSQVGGRYVRWSGRARGEILGGQEEGGAVFERFLY